MGGKQKQAQRTKGNTKPSSSARAAEFVQGSGGFIGFGALGSDLGYVPVTGGDDLDVSVDADFRMLLKKVTKKDTATKLKALGEISALCEEKDEESVKSILPFWPRIYNRLAIDCERRVREASHKTFQQVIDKVGRALAPHLKALIGPWLVSQCDPYAPAGSAAKSAFGAAFPPAKQTSALVFCKQEILAHIEDNLFTQLPQTLSDPKITEAEDMQTKYERVVAGSLGAWRLLLTQVPPQKDMIDGYKNIIGKAAFWKLQKHQSELIRASFYQVVSALCEAHPSEVRELKSKFCPAVLYSIDDTTPLVCPALWESALHMVTTVQDWWTVINPRKGMLPKLWKVLRSGGDGSAVVIYPNLLPLLSTMPAEETVCNQAFMEEFNSALVTGLSAERTNKSSRDINAILRAFWECMRFCVNSQPSGEDSSGNIVAQACLDKVLQMLEACLVEKSEMLHQSIFYELLKSFLKYSKDNSELAVISEILWQRLHELLLDKIKGSQDVSEGYVINRMSTLIDALLLSQTTSIKPADQAVKSKVRFSTEPIENLKPIRNELHKTVDLIMGTPEHKLVVDICSTLPVVCQNSNGTNLIKLSCHLLQCCGHNDGILSNQEAGEISRSQEVQVYIDNVLWKLIGRGQDVNIVETIVYLTCTVEDSSFDDVMESMFKKFEKSLQHIQTMVTTCVKLSSEKNNMKTWLSGDGFGKRIVASARELCSLIGKETEVEKRTNLLNIISQSLTGVNGEPVLGSQFIEEIVPELVKAIPASDYVPTIDIASLNSSVFFVCELATSLFPAFKENVCNTGCLTLLSELLKLNCAWPDNLNQDVRTLVGNAWQIGVKTVVKFGKSDALKVLKSLADSVKRYVFCDGLTWEGLTELISVGKSLLTSVEEREPERTLLLQTLHLEFKPSNRTLSGHVMNSFLPCKVPLEENLTLLTNSNVIRDLAPLCFDMNLKTYHDTDTNFVSELCRGIAYCNATKSCERQARELHNLGQIKRCLQEELTNLLKTIDSDELEHTFERMLDHANAEGGLSSLVLDVFLRNSRTNFAKTYSPKTQSTNEQVHTTLTLIPHLSQSSQENLISEMVDCIHQRADEGAQSIMDCHRYLAVLSELLSIQESTFCAESDAFIVSSTLIPFMQQWPHTEDNFFLFESEVTTVDWEKVRLVVQVMKFLRLMVEKSPTLLTPEHWDFILCSMLSWIHSCNESLEGLQNGEVECRTFAIQAFQLVSQVANCIHNITPEVAEGYPPQIKTEWAEFFSQGAYTVLLPVYVKIAEKLLQVKVGVSEDLLLSSLAMATSHCPLEHLLNHSLPAKLSADDKSGMSDSLQTILNHLCPLLLQNHASLQYCSFTLLRRLMQEVWKTEESSSGEDENRQPPSALWNIMDLCQDAMLTWTASFKIGDRWIPEVYSDEHGAATAYLLAWTLLIDLFTAATPPVRAAYATFLRENNAIGTLMFVLFTLMPEVPIVELRDKLSTQSATAKLCSTKNLFAEKPAYSSQGKCEAVDVGHLACSVYYSVLQHLPALARQWWNDQDRRVADIVDKFTAKYASPILCDEQISEVDESVFSESNMKVKTRPVTREVVAIYGVDEASLELLVTLAENHPLGPLKVESGKKTGIASTQWRNWMLQLTTFLLHQNGSIADGLVLWKRNVDKKFEGVEECMICFSIIHGSTCHLPKLQCKTCKKKFHSACLYKWFSTSNNSSCPMCRNLF